MGVKAGLQYKILFALRTCSINITGSVLLEDAHIGKKVFRPYRILFLSLSIPDTLCIRHLGTFLPFDISIQKEYTSPLLGSKNLLYGLIVEE